MIDAGSFKALDIAKLEEHPSLVRGRGMPKEGFSLLSLMNRAKCKQGSRTLRRWLSRPLTNVTDIHQRHDAVQYFVDRQGQEFIPKISKLLSKTGDLHRSLLRLKACNAHAQDWLTIAESLSHMQLALGELARQRAQLEGDAFPQLLDVIAQANESPGLFEVSRAMNLLDWEKLKVEINSPSPRVVPIFGASNEVDEVRQRCAQLPDLLAVETEAIGKPGVTTRCIPVIGFVTAVESNIPFEEVGSELLFEAAKHGDGDEVLRYFKTSRTKFLDAQLGDIPGLLRDTEDTFLRQVEHVVLAYEVDLYAVAVRCAELDALLSFAEIAHDFNYCRPEMTINPVSEIIAARHPLLERILENAFVPSDIRVDQNCLIITGPNYSGKSVILKTTALIHVMAQCGSFVPATSAKLGVVDRIFTRIASIEAMGGSAYQRESSFTIDLQQVVSMLRCCTPNSLILVDEFGKGTNSWTGSALLASVVQHLSHGKCGPTPRCVFATHLVEIFDAKLLGPGDTRRAEMSVEFDEKEPIPLFRLQNCTADDKTRESYGVACAHRSGLNESVVERANELTNRLSRGLPLWHARERFVRERQMKINSLISTFMQQSPSLGEWSDEKIINFLNALIDLRC